MDETNTLLADGEMEFRIGGKTVTARALTLGKSLAWSKAVRRAILETSGANMDAFVKEIAAIGLAATKPEQVLEAFDNSTLCESISRPLMFAKLITLHSPHITSEMLEDATANQLQVIFEKLWETENPFVRIR